MMNCKHQIVSNGSFGYFAYCFNKNKDKILITPENMREFYIENIDKRHHGPHSLRHTLASQMLKNGEELTTISATLGHSSTQVTTVYLSVDHSRLKECCIPKPKLHSPHYSLED